MLNGISNSIIKSEILTGVESEFGENPLKTKSWFKVSQKYRYISRIGPHIYWAIGQDS